MKVTLPTTVRVYDYHEFDEVARHLALVVKGVKVKELGFDGDYVGIAYTGRLTDPANKEMVKQITKDIKEYHVWREALK